MTEHNANRSLEEVFKSTFHSKMSFSELLTLKISEHYRKVTFKKRIVYAPSPTLKQVHRFINNTILEYAEFNEEVVFSYRKGATPRDAVLKHADSEHFFQTDIYNFYNNIRNLDVARALNNRLHRAPISDLADHIGRILELVVADDHIPVGFSTSPILSNICLFDFDNALLEYCNSTSLKYTRYSDDIIISGKNDDVFENLAEKIEELLEASINPYLKLNKEKTKRHKKGHNFKILGFNILPNGVVTIPSADKKYLETLLYFFLTDQGRFEDYFKKYMESKQIALGDKPIREHAIDTLSGKLIAFNSMDKNYISKLRNKYGNTVLDMFIRKSVK